MEFLCLTWLVGYYNSKQYHLSAFLCKDFYVTVRFIFIIVIRFLIVPLISYTYEYDSLLIINDIITINNINHCMTLITVCH